MFVQSERLLGCSPCARSASQSARHGACWILAWLMFDEATTSDLVGSTPAGTRMNQNEAAV